MGAASPRFHPSPLEGEARRWKGNKAGAAEYGLMSAGWDFASRGEAGGGYWEAEVHPLA